jgi:hypothetical protein
MHYTYIDDQRLNQNFSNADWSSDVYTSINVHCGPVPIRFRKKNLWDKPVHLSSRHLVRP